MSQQVVRRPQSTQDWESQKAKIAELYESNELKETMKVMENKHGFKATYACFRFFLSWFCISFITIH